jgi:hypothetical protein
MFLVKAVIQLLGDLIHASDTGTRERIDSVKVLRETFAHLLGNIVYHIVPVGVLADSVCTAVFKCTAEVVGPGADEYVDVFVFHC